MPKLTKVFKRTEKKYRITAEQYEELIKRIGDYLCPDKFGRSTINNIYFDTPDWRLIRASIEKPTVYKEKLRIRSYGHPTAESKVFIELKKKYKGVVYKRRVDMSYIDSLRYLCKHQPPPVETQITREIDYFMKFYKNLRPKVSLFYDRIAYYSKDDKEVRLTFDTNIRYRMKDFDMSKGDFGRVILDESEMLLEIKTPGAMPLWLTDALNDMKIYPTSYSKYGTAYKLMLSETLAKHSADGDENKITIK